MARDPNRMSEAVNRLASRFADFAAITISYFDGTSLIEGIPATVGRTPYEETDGQVIVTHEARDYIVQAALLVENGNQITPANDHTITEADGTVYMVAMPKGMNVYERIGPGRSVFRIHTKGPV